MLRNAAVKRKAEMLAAAFRFILWVVPYEFAKRRCRRAHRHRVFACLGGTQGTYTVDALQYL